MFPQRNRFFLTLLIAAGCIVLIGVSSITAQRDDDDDFDDAGFDNAGYSPQSQDDASSNQNPSGSASSVSDVDDIDDDDDVDETHVSPQVASEENQQADQQQQQQQNQHQHMQQPELSMAQQANYALQGGHQMQVRPQQDRSYYPDVAPQHFYSAPNSVLLANVDPSGRSFEQRHSPYRYKRSTLNARRSSDENDVEDALKAEQQSLIRHKRHSKYIGPVYTYVKTDKHARFKWGVKHKVGKKKHG